MTEDPMERLVQGLMQDTHTARLANRIAAIVTDTCRENFENLAHERGDEAVPVTVVVEMLDGILAALAGQTEWEKLRGVHPRITPVAWMRIQALVNGPRLVGGDH